MESRRKAALKRLTTDPCLWRLPLHVCPMGVYIFDADHQMIVEVRGWGGLTGTGGGHALDDSTAEAVQRARLEALVAAINRGEG